MPANRLLLDTSSMPGTTQPLWDQFNSKGYYHRNQQRQQPSQQHYSQQSFKRPPRFPSKSTQSAAKQYNREDLRSVICLDYLKGCCETKRWTCKYAHPPLEVLQALAAAGDPSVYVDGSIPANLLPSSNPEPQMKSESNDAVPVPESEQNGNTTADGSSSSPPAAAENNTSGSSAENMTTDAVAVALPAAQATAEQQLAGVAPRKVCDVWMLTGTCKFGRTCRNMHPPRDELSYFTYAKLPEDLPPSAQKLQQQQLSVSAKPFNPYAQPTIWDEAEADLLASTTLTALHPISLQIPFPVSEAGSILAAEVPTPTSAAQPPAPRVGSGHKHRPASLSLSLEPTSAYEAEATTILQEASQTSMVSQHEPEKTESVGVTTAEAIMRKIRGMLNRLTREKFDGLVNNFMNALMEVQLAPTSKDSAYLFNDVISEILLTAIREPSLSQLYAEFCYVLCHWVDASTNTTPAPAEATAAAVATRPTLASEFITSLTPQQRQGIVATKAINLFHAIVTNRMSEQLGNKAPELKGMSPSISTPSTPSTSVTRMGAVSIVAHLMIHQLITQDQIFQLFDDLICYTTFMLTFLADPQPPHFGPSGDSTLPSDYGSEAPTPVSSTPALTPYSISIINSPVLPNSGVSSNFVCLPSMMVPLPPLLQDQPAVPAACVASHPRSVSFNDSDAAEQPAGSTGAVTTTTATNANNSPSSAPVNVSSGSSGSGGSGGNNSSSSKHGRDADKLITEVTRNIHVICKLLSALGYLLDKVAKRHVDQILNFLECTVLHYFTHASGNSSNNTDLRSISIVTTTSVSSVSSSMRATPTNELSGLDSRGDCITVFVTKVEADPVVEASATPPTMEPIKVMTPSMNCIASFSSLMSTESVDALPDGASTPVLITTTTSSSSVSSPAPKGVKANTNTVGTPSQSKSPPGSTGCSSRRAQMLVADLMELRQRQWNNDRRAPSTPAVAATQSP